jgi:hypothetical protein
MYDRQTESWWQQFTGDAIVGAMTGRQLRLVPSRLESSRFKQRFPNAMVLVPTDPAARDYGANPYVGYDTTGQRPFLYDGTLPDGIEPMERVVAVETAPEGHETWSLSFLRQAVTSRATISSSRGKLDRRLRSTSTLAAGRDVGNIIVQPPSALQYRFIAIRDSAQQQSLARFFAASEEEA